MKKDVVLLACGVELTKQEEIDVIDSILKIIDDNSDNFNFNSLASVNIAFTFKEISYIDTLIQRRKKLIRK